MTEILPTHQLKEAGQSPWLDTISRGMITSGELSRLIQEKGLLGMTSNPSIFEKAMSQEGAGYDQDFKKFARRGKLPYQIYETMAIADIQAACDGFKNVFEDTQGEHGFVSLEVIPSLAYDTQASTDEALRLWKAVKRPNVMIKIPATPEGIPAIRTLISQGVNINVTLIFSIPQYVAVARAYIAGLQEFAKRGGDVSQVYSVASVFVSRIDTLIDKKIDALIADSKKESEKLALAALKGKAAIANSKLIYQEFKRLFQASDFKALEEKDANIQKVLWGSTSTKNPSYPDLIYVEPLVGPETVNTMPQQTLEALLDHGVISPNTIEEGLEEVDALIPQLKQRGFDLTQIGEQLQEEGVKSFCDSFDSLMRTLEKRYEKESKSTKNPDTRTQIFYGKDATAKKIQASVKKFNQSKVHQRFLAKDASLWKADGNHQKVINNRLGWLDAPEWMLGKLYDLEEFQAQLRREGFRSIVLLGMGGSSLAPEVFREVFGVKKPFRFFVLDSTDSAAVLAVEKAIDLKTTLFIVASKSGSTIETNSQFRYFYSRVEEKVAKKKGKGCAGSHFIAITDPGSSLQALAREKNFRRLYLNPANIGGRYSALSLFGLVPAALAGIDVRPIVNDARQYLAEFRAKPQDTLALGYFLGEWAKKGKNKLILWPSKTLSSVGAWLEQLIAESTGKEYLGIVPVDGSKPQILGGVKDRVYGSLCLKSDKNPAATFLQKIKKQREPVFEMIWPKPVSIGRELLRWEIITSIASVVLGINPFDEPNVKESKDNTGEILGKLKSAGKIPDSKSAYDLNKAEALRAFFEKAKKKGYVSILAFIERNSKTIAALNQLRELIAKELEIPVLVGFGPRYLHSIGQLYKGGPKEGAFFFITAADKFDIAIPEAGYNFSSLLKAQAMGDIRAVEKRSFPMIQIQLPSIQVLPNLIQKTRAIFKHA